MRGKKKRLLNLPPSKDQPVSKFYKYFFLMNIIVITVDIRRETSNKRAKAEGLFCKGSLTFIPYKLANIVGIDIMIVSDVNSFITVFKLFDTREE